MDKVNIFGHSTGLHLIAEFAEIDFTPPLLEKIERGGARVYPVETHAIRRGNHRNRIILGYGNLTAEKIEEGVRRLAAVLTE
ncbi:MAG TPA: hypothetical protein VMS09_15920 [Paenibacillus sp.]|uniref:hypothetical protein n=1 Tax=Paenibacillus sp. TaxID=58172 RepID=UPI002C53C62C|nr:hypothetical protein [Paenibacillus sp.]HUC93483.1 hypothetical protein [Paenibacillus sp.]